MAQVVALLQCVGKQGKAFRRGNQYTHIAVAQDVADLLGLQQRIERYKDTTGSGGAKTGDDSFEALFEVDGDSLATLKSKAD